MALYDYSENTFDVIKTRMLEMVDSNLDKREGSLIYNSIAAVASELEQCYIAIQTILDEIDPATASIDGLSLLAAAFGLTIKEASYAKVRCHFAFKSGYEPVIMTGYSFIANTNKQTYTVGEPINDSATDYFAYCDASGTVGNTTAGWLLPTAEIEGYQSGSIQGIEELGAEDETLEEFRARYYNALRVRPFAGNIDYYKQAVGALDGVGAVQVHPHWNGGGTVNVCVMSDSGTALNPSSLRTIQDLVDPTVNYPYKQSGVGLAPIDHKVTVSTPDTVAVKVSLTITGTGYSADAINKAVYQYFADLRDKWDVEDDTGRYNLTVYRSQIMSAVLAVDNVEDVSACELNDKSENITLVEEITSEQNSQRPVVSEVIVNGKAISHI